MTCKDCIHYDICVFHTKGNENEKCAHFKNKADFVEVVRCKDCKHKVLIKDNRVMCSRNAQKMGCVADFIIAMEDASNMKYYAFKNIRNGKYISGTNFNTYPYRQILADEYRPPKLFAEDDVAREVMHRQINLNTYKVVEVQIKE